MRKVLVLAVLLSACNASSSTSRPPDGKERGACYGNGTCDDGLTCLSSLCVRPPGADCAQIADKLSSLMLGNYAEAGARDGYVSATRAECEAANVSKDDGACILAATTRNQLLRCKTIVGAGDCTAITGKLKDLPGQDQFRTSTADELAARCKNELPSKGLEACVMAAKKVSDLDACVW
jgi:hypothetical protein